MKNLISINNKFMKISPKKLVSMIKNTKSVKGLEIYINIDSSFEMNYLDELVFEIKKENLILQIHGNSELELPKQIEFLKKIESYVNYLGYKIIITLHPIYHDNKEISKKKTTLYMKSIIDNIDNNKLLICLENLNDIFNYDRLKTNDITPIILNEKYLYFTYDLGHALINNDNLTNLNKNMIKKIRNIHIHTNDGMGSDHIPIYSNDKNWQQLLKGLTYLINNKYQYNIVYEYNVDVCHGNSIENKVEDYLKSIDYISFFYNISKNYKFKI